MNYLQRLFNSQHLHTQRKKQRHIFVAALAALFLFAAPFATAMSIAPNGVDLMETVDISEDNEALAEMCSSLAYSHLYQKCIALASGLVTGELTLPEVQVRDIQDLSSFAVGLSAGGQEVLEAYISGQVGSELTDLSGVSEQDLQNIIDERAQGLAQAKLHYQNVQDWYNGQQVSDDINTQAQYYLSLVDMKLTDAEKLLQQARREFLPSRILFTLNDVTAALDDAAYFMNKAVHLIEAEKLYDQDLDLDAAITGGDFSNFAESYRAISISGDLTLNGITNYRDLITFLEAYDGPLPEVVDLSRNGGSSTPVQVPTPSFGGEEPVVADINLDGVVDLNDLLLLIAALKDFPIEGDADVTGDGHLDFFDISLLLENFDHDNPGFPEGPGDVDGNGNVSNNDLKTANQHAVAGTYAANADVNNDGAVDVWDILQIMGAWSEGFDAPSLSAAMQLYDVNLSQLYCDWLESQSIELADFDIDGDVDFCDWTEVAGNQGKAVPVGMSGDVTGDGFVDASDLQAFATSYTSGDCYTPAGHKLADFDDNGVVDDNDLGTLMKYFTAEVPVEPFTNGDLTGNGVVDEVDLYLMINFLENGYELLDLWGLDAPQNPFPLTTCNLIATDLTNSDSSVVAKTLSASVLDVSSTQSSFAVQPVSVDDVLGGTLGWCLDCVTDVDCDLDVDAVDINLVTLAKVPR